MRARLLTATLLALSAPCLAQATWTQLSPTTSPNPRAGMVLRYDGIGALFFSGNLGPSGVPSQFPSELWRFNGTDWTLLTPNPDLTNGVPDGRQWYAAAVDLARGVYVLFGGQKGSGLSNLLGDTWEYNIATNTWAMKSPTTSPTARRWAAMEYHAATGTCIMFGGETANGSTYTDETWEWDGTDWTLLTPANAPSARGRGKMLYDPSTQETAYVCGRHATADINQVWVWDSTDWTRLTTTNSPGVAGNTGVYAHDLTYDLLRSRYVLYGGDNLTNGFNDRTWEFDRSTNTWTDRGATTGLSGRTGPGLAYVPTLGKSFLFGGFNGTQLGDTWEYQTNAIATFTNVGTGCPTSLGTPSLSATTLPWIGTNFTMAVDNIPATAVAVMLTGVNPINFSLGAIGIGDAGCVALVDPIPPAFLSSMAATMTTTVWDVTLPIPGIPALVGGTLLNQAVIVDFGPARTYVSDRGDATFGAL